VLRGLTWIGARARWVLAAGVVAATFLPSLSATLRPFVPGLVVLLLCISMARLDLGMLAQRASRPRRMAVLTGWIVALMVVTPAVIWAGARAAGLPEAHLAALVYTFAAPPIASAPAVCLMMGLEAGFALELTILASLAAPFVGPVVSKVLLGEAVPLDAFDLALRMAAMIAGGVAAALAMRRLIGPGRIARHGGAFDGVATVVLLLFVIPIFDRFWEVVLNLPWFALGTLVLVLVAVRNSSRRNQEPRPPGVPELPPVVEAPRTQPTAPPLPPRYFFSPFILSSFRFMRACLWESNELSVLVPLFRPSSSAWIS